MTFVNWFCKFFGHNWEQIHANCEIKLLAKNAQGEEVIDTQLAFSKLACSRCHIVGVKIFDDHFDPTIIRLEREFRDIVNDWIRDNDHYEDEEEIVEKTVEIHDIT